MIKQKVFIPVSTKDELPDDNGQYFTIHPNDHSGFIYDVNEFYDSDFYLSEDGGYPSDISKTTHWLKEQEGHFFSTTQLKFFAKKCFDAGRDSFAYEIGDTFEEDEIVHETFIEFFESLGIK